MKCEDPQCAGCYQVAPGVHIHPPKCGEEYQLWKKKWEQRQEARTLQEKPEKPRRKLKQKWDPEKEAARRRKKPPLFPGKT